jgi:hypothetical protein
VSRGATASDATKSEPFLIVVHMNYMYTLSRKALISSKMLPVLYILPKPHSMSENAENVAILLLD